jgi:hypothetical protein
MTVKHCVVRNAMPGHTWWDLRRAEVERMKAMRRNGMTYQAIAEAMGRSQGAVYRWITGREYQ